MDFDSDIELELRYRAKALLRKRARALRNTIPRQAITERSQKIQQTLSSLPVFQSAACIALFYPIEGRNEVDLMGLDPVLRARGVKVVYPKIHDETRVLTFHYMADPHAMQPGAFGLREPGPNDEQVSQLDIVVVPALQIDERGHRIGYGAGFYDRTLPLYCPPGVSIAVGFDFQLISEVPVTEGDVAVDIVVTDACVLTLDCIHPEADP